MDGLRPNTVEWGVAAKQMPGETLSGDHHLVKSTDRGTLVAVADGLGHGKEAAEASKLALDTLEQCEHAPVAKMLEHCSQRLRGTRGVVMSLAFLSSSDDTMEWLGVGNVVGLLLPSPGNGKRAIASLMLFQGVVGVRLPLLRTTLVPVVPGDTLIFATDGIRRGFEEGMVLREAPGKTAQDILARDFLGTDDGLVLVAKYKGRPQ